MEICYFFFFLLCAILMEEIYFVKINSCFKENILFVWSRVKDEQKEEINATRVGRCTIVEEMCITTARLTHGFTITVMTVNTGFGKDLPTNLLEGKLLSMWFA